MFHSFAIIVAASFACIVDVEAGEFLAQSPARHLTREILEQTLLAELPSSSNSARLASFREQLQPTFITLPKNEQGQLEAPTVRYALHRFFVHRHGWFVKGLDPTGDGWNSDSSSSSAEIVAERAPVYIQELFQKRLQGRGLGLDELAVFAATLSDLIYQDANAKLIDMAHKLQYAFSDDISENSFDVAVRAFIADTITGIFNNITGRDNFDNGEQEARGFYPEYDDIIMWARDIHQTQLWAQSSSKNPFGKSKLAIDHVFTYMQGLLHNFGGLMKAECRKLKEDLMDMERVGNGLVLLSDFYANANLQMHESVDYIRNMGALEEEGNPRLVMVNYISSPSRCMPFSSFYSVCCPDECEGLLGSLERSIAAPSALPAKIAEIVSGLPSDTVAAPRNLSTVLRARLEEIAATHDGQVPLHGRLFKQWMHHAYPRECPYPHVAGTTKPVTQDEWLEMHQHLEDALVSDDEREHHVKARAERMEIEESLRWVQTEELVAVDRKVAMKDRRSMTVVRVIFGVIALASVALPLVRTSSALIAPQPEHKAHMV